MLQKKVEAQGWRAARPRMADAVEEA